MEGQELRGRYPLTESYLRAHEWDDETMMLRVAIIVSAISIRSPMLTRLLVRWWAQEYR